MEKQSTLRELRFNFSEIRDELTAALLLCVPADDQFERVMFTIAELLQKEVESIEISKQFDSSPILAEAHAVLDSCKTTDDDRELVVIKFARSFVLFMEALSGLQLHPNTCEETRSRVRQLPQRGGAKRIMVENEHTVFFESNGQGYSGQPKRPRMFVVPSPPNAKPKQKRHSSGTSPVKMGEPNTLLNVTRPDYVHYVGYSEENIKIEEPDEETWNNMPGSSAVNDTVAAPMAEMKDEIKEEPIEEPLRDKISFGSCGNAAQVFLPVPGTSGHFAPIAGPPSKTKGQKRQKALTPYAKAQIRKQYGCPICDEPVHLNKMEQHFRSFHKGEWMNFASRCPEMECDFRSDLKDVHEAHRTAVHNSAYELWKSTSRMELPKSSKCPFCSLPMISLAQYINHLEMNHPRLATYDVPLIKCASCRFNTARIYNMYIHWQKSPTCTSGMQIIHDNAKGVMNVDAMIEKKERNLNRKTLVDRKEEEEKEGE